MEGSVGSAVGWVVGTVLGSVIWVLSASGEAGAAGQPARQDKAMDSIKKTVKNRCSCIVAHLHSKDKHHYMCFSDKSQQMGEMGRL